MKTPEQIVDQLLEDDSKQAAKDFLRRQLAKPVETRYEEIVFMQGDDGAEALHILNNEGEEAVIEYLKNWYDPGHHPTTTEDPTEDSNYYCDGEFIVVYSYPDDYVGFFRQFKAIKQ